MRRAATFATFFVLEKIRVTPIQALARPHGASPLRREPTPDQQFGQIRWKPDGATRLRVRGKRDRKNRTQMCDFLVSL
jgi:hypothetical protein